MAVLSSTKMDRFSKKVLLWAFVADMIILPAVFVKLFFNPWPSTPIAMAATNRQVAMGSTTESLLLQLKDSGLAPVVVAKVTRQPFAVPDPIGTGEARCQIQP